MMKCRAVAAFIACGALAACTSPTVTQPTFQQPQPLPVYDVKTTFDEGDFAWSTENGEAVVTGEAFLKTQGGDVRTCAGNVVSLVPVNSYTNELAQVLPKVGVRYSGLDTDPRYQNYRRTRRCRSDGSFTFSGVPAGEWYLSAVVFWKAPGTYIAVPQGGTLLRKINIESGENREAILTQVDKI